MIKDKWPLSKRIRSECYEKYNVVIVGGGSTFTPGF